MNLKKILSATIAASVLFVGNYPADAASKKDPFSDVKIVQMSDSEKASYIDKKTTDYLTPKDTSSKKKSYEVPRGWKQERISYNGVAVEKFTAKKNSNGSVCTSEIWQDMLQFSCRIIELRRVMNILQRWTTQLMLIVESWQMVTILKISS